MATQLPQWLLVQAITGLTVAYTSPNALLRPAAVVALVALSISVQIDALTPGRDLRVAGPLAAMGWVNLLNGIELLLLSRASYPAQLYWEKQQKLQTLTTKLAWAFWIPFNYRRVCTPWQIKRLPSFDRKDPEYVPSRTSFLLLCAGKAPLCALLVHLFTVDLQYPGMGDQLAIIWGQRPEVSLLQHMLVQTSFMIPFAIVIRAFIVGSYSLTALVFVGLGVSEPALWPPISGSLLDAWSLRRLWGITWHQLLRTPLLAVVNFLISSVLRIPRASTPAYILRLVLVFALSGAVHLGMDLGFSVSIKDTGAMQFYVLQGLGMIFEQLVLSIWNAGFGRKRVGTAGKVVGYIWVCGFLAATVSTWLVPIIGGLYVDDVRGPVSLFLGWRTLLA